MKERRVVLVMVPPLLADLIKHVLEARIRRDVEISIIADDEHAQDIGERVRRLAPDVLIVRAMVAPSLWAEVSHRHLVRVLSLSDDLTGIHGPGPGDSAPLTPDVLAELLHGVLASI